MIGSVFSTVSTKPPPLSLTALGKRPHRLCEDDREEALGGVDADYQVRSTSSAFYAAVTGGSAKVDGASSGGAASGVKSLNSSRTTTDCVVECIRRMGILPNTTCLEPPTLRLQQHADSATADRLRPLSNHAIARVDAAIGPTTGDATVLLNKFDQVIRGSHMRCLAPVTWLVDEILNIYMTMLQERDVRLRTPTR